MEPVRRRRAFLRDAVVATLVLAGLYGLVNVQFRPLQIPGYLLIVGFDLLEAAFGPAGSAHAVLFAAYLVGLGLAGATVAGAVRSRDLGAGRSAWRLGAVGALGLVGVLALLFALTVLVGTDQWRPVAITGLTGVALLAVAVQLAGAG